MLIKVLRPSLLVLMLATLISIMGIIGTYLVLKPTLPKINLVDEDILQIPLKVFSSDGILIGEFGDQKRRTIEYDDIPLNLKNAFLAAEDDKFFEHNGIRILSFVRAFFQLIESREIVSGGGTITMQVVRGYLLSREQRIIRKIKEIYLAFELETNASKEEILSLNKKENIEVSKVKEEDKKKKRLIDIIKEKVVSKISKKENLENK